MNKSTQRGGIITCIPNKAHTKYVLSVREAFRIPPANESFTVGEKK